MLDREKLCLSLCNPPLEKLRRSEAHFHALPERDCLANVKWLVLISCHEVEPWVVRDQFNRDGAVKNKGEESLAGATRREPRLRAK